MADPIPVPHGALSEGALTGLIEEFITREGTDYGPGEYSLEQKRASVLRQLERGEAVILFDPDSESTTIVRRDELARGPR